MRKDARLKQILQEVLKSTPKRAPLPLNPQIMAKMAKQLRDAKEMVTRMEQSLPMFFRMFEDENMTRELIRTVCLTSSMELEGKLTTCSDCSLCNSIVIKSTTLGIILPSLLKSLKLQSQSFGNISPSRCKKWSCKGTLWYKRQGLNNPCRIDRLNHHK